MTHDKTPEETTADQSGDAVHGPSGDAETGPLALQRGMGDGEMPGLLWRFNWGAFMLPVFWGVAYGVWPLVLGWVLTIVVPLVLIAMLAPQGTSLGGNTLITATIISEIAAGILRLYSGSSANRLSWKREARRLALLPGTTPRFSLQQFLARQRTWIVVGAGLLALSMASVTFLGLSSGSIAEQVRVDAGITRMDAWISGVFLGAEVAMGLWLGSKMREEAPL